MPADGTKKRAKFPRFVEYANARERFQEKTPANMQWAQELSLPLLKRSGESLGPPEEAWQVLGTHQLTFQQFLDAIIGSRDKPTLITREMMQTLTQHCADIVLESRWDSRPANLREQEAQRDTMKAAARLAAMRDRLAAKWGVPESEHPIVQPPPKTPPNRYHETWTPSDPLDGVYWDLREFLRRGQPERLQKCPVCQCYFVRVTARLQTYCGTPCRLKGNHTKERKEQNAQHQRERRALVKKRAIENDLKKVREAKKRLKDENLREFDLTMVLNKSGITERRWNTLQRWEVTHHGKPRVTVLP
jgi:hypothetical protein